MLNKLRPQVKIMIDPLVKRINVNPNILTLIGLFVSLLAAYMFSQGDTLFGGLFIAVGGFVDILDGAVARSHGSTTNFGGVLDSTSDRFADAFLIIGIIYGGFVNWIYGILALHASLTVSYVRARAESEGIECRVGLLERAERLIIIMAGAFLTYFINFKIFGLNFLGLAIVLIMILGYLTVIQRLYHSWKELKNN